MKAIWTQDDASYAAEYVAFDRIWSWLEPTRKPQPPVLVGGNGPGVLTGCWPSATHGSRAMT